MYILTEEIKLNKKQSNVQISLGNNTNRDVDVSIICYDKDKKNSVYYDCEGYASSNGETVYEIRLPLAPKNIVIELKSKAKLKTSFKIIKLETYKDCIKKSFDFIRFASDFCVKLSSLTEGRYTSDNGKYTIDLLDDIIDLETGERLNTPARISIDDGRIEVSIRRFLPFTIPMRFAILMHEIAHFYINDVMDDELEADMNALKIYLGFGFPIIEGHKAFLRTFQKAPTKLNRVRYETLKKFMDNFENEKYNSCTI